MKVFWSWQSDLPGKISRYLIRDALDAAIQELNSDLAVEEPNRDGEVTLDQDRKGTVGSPTLAEVIFEKIRASDVFVADVTPVGLTPAAPAKKLINSNVAIELGFALGALSDRRLLMVLNTAYGVREDLPFDLRHKAGPISYQLHSDADKATIATAKKALTVEFKSALKGYLSEARPTASAFERAPSQLKDPSRYFDASEPVVQMNANFRQAASTLMVPQGALVYLRLSPTKQRSLISFPDALDFANAGRLRPFTFHELSSATSVNAFGAIAYSAINDENHVLEGTQLFRNGELWGFNAYLPAPVRKPDDRSPPGIWAREMEQAFIRYLPMYANFMHTTLNCLPPYQFEAGLSVARPLSLYVAGDSGMIGVWGPFLQDTVTMSGQLKSFDVGEINAALLKIFNGFFEAVGHRRPDGFNNFPKSGNENADPVD
jgi:hypothetical protein